MLSSFAAPIRQHPDPPGRVEGAPAFATEKKRSSYFEEFESKRGQFNEDCVRAQRLSAEAASRTEEVTTPDKPSRGSGSSDNGASGRISLCSKCGARDDSATLPLDASPGILWM